MYMLLHTQMQKTISPFRKRHRCKHYVFPTSKVDSTSNSTCIFNSEVCRAAWR